jgi:hypothetical protein
MGGVGSNSNGVSGAIPLDVCGRRLVYLGGRVAVEIAVAGIAGFRSIGEGMADCARRSAYAAGVVGTVAELAIIQGI